MPRRTPPHRRDDILSAAKEEFSSRGFAAARMEDIARRVGISKAALYLQFDTKEALFRALVESLIADTLPHMLPQDFGDRPATELLKAFVPAALRRVAGGDIAFVPRLIIGEANRFPELASFYHDKAVSRILALLERLIRHGIARGEFREVDARNAARSIAGGVIVSALWRTVLEPVGAEPIDLDAMGAAHLDIVLNGLSVREATR